jgi:hypothetical protein
MYHRYSTCTMYTMYKDIHYKRRSCWEICHHASNTIVQRMKPALRRQTCRKQLSIQKKGIKAGAPFKPLRGVTNTKHVNQNLFWLSYGLSHQVTDFHVRLYVRSITSSHQLSCETLCTIYHIKTCEIILTLLDSTLPVMQGADFPTCLSIYTLSKG